MEMEMESREAILPGRPSAAQFVALVLLIYNYFPAQERIRFQYAGPRHESIRCDSGLL